MPHTRLRLATALIALGLGSTANALSLTVVPDEGSYQVGETITLTVIADTSGGFTSFGIFGRLLFDNPSVASFAAGTPTQIPLFPPAPINGWEVFPVSCAASSCDMLSQGQGFGFPPPVPALLINISQVSFLATAPGVANVSWETDPSSGFALDFLGLTNAPGTVITVLPEPATGALLGLGLLGIARLRRRRH